MPPVFWAWATTCRARVVLPEDSGPYTSTMRPRGSPPTPRAMSSPSEPVGTTFTSGGAISSPRRMMLPFPNCFSMVETASSMALSRWVSRSRGNGVTGAALTASSLLSFDSAFSSVAMSLSCLRKLFPSQLQVRVGRRPADPFPATGEELAASLGGLGAGQREAYRAHRLLSRLGGSGRGDAVLRRAGHSGDGDRHGGVADALGPVGHLLGALLADGA